MPTKIDDKIKGPVTLNEHLVERSIRHQVFIARHGSGRANRIANLLDEVIPDLTARIETRLRRTKARGYDLGPVTTRRLQTLFVSLNEVVDLHMDEMYKQMQIDLLALSKQEAAFEAGAIRSEALKLNIKTPVVVDLLVPGDQVLNSIVHARPFRGKLLREHFNKLRSNQKEALKQAVRLGMAEGDSIAQITRRIAGTRAAGYRDSVFSQPRHQLQAFVRTAVNHVSTHARLATLAENSAVIKSEQIIATLDNRTSSICRFQDGRIYQMGRGPRPPFHYNCRSTVVPVLKSWKEMGLNFRETPKSTRAALGGEVAEDVTYPTWFKRQSAGLQREILGPTRYDLYKNGKIDSDILRFSDREGRLYNLDELRKRESDAFAAIESRAA